MKSKLPTCLVALLLVAGGCTHQKFTTGAQHPEVAVDQHGVVTYRGEAVDPEDLPDLLKDSGLTRTDTIHIHIVSGLTNYSKPYYVMGLLVKNGFTRTVFVEDRQSFSTVKPASKKKAPSAPATRTAPRTIRYK